MKVITVPTCTNHIAVGVKKIAPTDSHLFTSISSNNKKCNESQEATNYCSGEHGDFLGSLREQTVDISSP